EWVPFGSHTPQKKPDGLPGDRSCAHGRWVENCLRCVMSRPRPALGLRTCDPRLETSQEVDHSGVDLVGYVLLSPVATTRQHARPPQLGNELRQGRDELVHAAKGHHEVAIAGDVKRGDCHMRRGKWGQEFPVAIDVAVPVQSATKPGAREFTRIAV